MIFESMRMAWRSLMLGKLRAFLTMLGIIIGVGAVIALISIGQAATGSVTSQIQALGSNLITVTPLESSGAVLYYPQDVTWLQEVVPQISADAPLMTGGVTSDYGSQSYSTTLMGTTPPSLKIQGRSLAAGRYIIASDVTYRRDVAVIGQTVEQQLFGVRSGLGQTIFVDGAPLTVVGVLKAAGGSFGANEDDVILTPITTAEEILGTNRISSIIAEARSARVAPLAVAQIEAVMDTRFANQNAAMVVSQDQILSTLSTITSTLTLMLGGIAGISLLVGGIGIMNIMLVTVAERTREIGLRKAIGARRGAILTQFLVESGILSLLGGAIGAVLGSLGAKIMASALGWSGGVATSSIVLALGFSLVVGIVFGMWPAMRASRLDPIEALRQG